jgi:DNA repair protein RecO (recombination protein O)
MKQLVSTGIILGRTDYGEADRILTVLTPDFGKLSLLAKGVRRVKSKLAGGIELFSVSDITFIKGRGEMGTLTSSRLLKHYSGIVGNLERTMLGYELIKELHKVTESEAETEYFELLRGGFEALDDASIPLPVIKLWFGAQLLRQSGHEPNLQTDDRGDKLDPALRYSFSFDAVAFAPSPEHGRFGADQIKFLRLAFSGYPAKVLASVQGSGALVEAAAPLVSTMRNTYLRI